jgi:acetyl esterase/lipase
VRPVRYGPDPGKRLHVFPAPVPGAPLVVFVHGGCWQELTELESSFAAREVLAAGAACAAVGYGLAPRLRLGEIVTQVRQAVLSLCRNASTLNADPERVVLVGHSAGAHLVCMSLVDPLPDHLTPRDLAVLYSLDLADQIARQTGIAPLSIEDLHLTEDNDTRAPLPVGPDRTARWPLAVAGGFAAQRTQIGPSHRVPRARTSVTVVLEKC